MATQDEYQKLLPISIPGEQAAIEHVRTKFLKPMFDALGLTDQDIYWYLHNEADLQYAKPWDMSPTIITAPKKQLSGLDFEVIPQDGTFTFDGKTNRHYPLGRCCFEYFTYDDRYFTTWGDGEARYNVQHMLGTGSCFVYIRRAVNRMMNTPLERLSKRLITAGHWEVLKDAKRKNKRILLVVPWILSACLREQFQARKAG